MKYFKTWMPPVVIILIALIFPLLIEDSSGMAVEVLLLTGAAAAWNIFSGYTGYISLGQATYYGIGGYVLTLASQDWHMPGGYGIFFLLPLAGLVAGVFSIPLGWIALHTRRYSFMVITIAIFFIFQLLANNLKDITGGNSGVFLPLPTWSADLANIPFYYVALALLLLIVFTSWWLRHHQYGLILLAIRDDEDRVRGLGHRVELYKMGAYTLSAVLTGMIGALAIYFAGFIAPSTAFDKTFDITIVTMTFFGGIGSIAGPLVGGLLLEPFQAYLTQQFSAAAASMNQILFGCFLLAVILLFPQGIVPSLYKRWQMWRISRSKIDTGQATLALFKDSPVVSSEIPVPLAWQAESVPTISEQQSPVSQVIPEHNGERFEPLFFPPVHIVQGSQRVKALRLVPILGDNSLPVVSGKSIAPPPVSWRCPNCKIPFLLSGDTCYCRRCGLTRSLSSLPSV